MTFHHDSLAVVLHEEHVTQHFSLLLIGCSFVEGIMAFCHHSLGGVSRNLIVVACRSFRNSVQSVVLHFPELLDASGVQSHTAEECQSGTFAGAPGHRSLFKLVCDVCKFVDDEIIALLFGGTCRVNLLLGRIEGCFFCDQRNSTVALYHREVVERAKEACLGLTHGGVAYRRSFYILDEVVELAVQVVAVVPPTEGGTI